MIDQAALRRAMIAGTVLQLALGSAAHLSVWLAAHALLFGAMLISASMAYLYALDVGSGYAAGALGGTLAGGTCGLFGAAFTIVLGDTDPSAFLENVAIFAFTGALGGLFGQLAQRLQPSRR
jgi:hypothetical protein